MKTSLDPRHLHRQKIIQGLFEWSFRNHKSAGAEVKKIVSKLATVDKLITTAAPEWPLDKISKVDLAILRLAIYELLFNKETPAKVIIDEAVELGKEFGGDSSSKFINGALGKAIKLLK